MIHTKIKTLKCSGCHCDVPYVADKIDLALSTCKRFQADGSCPLDHLVGWLHELHMKDEKEKSRYVPITQDLIDHHKKKQIPRLLEAKNDCGVGAGCQHGTCGPCVDEGSGRLAALLEAAKEFLPPDKTPKVVKVDEEKKEFEIELDDPIHIVIDKKGKRYENTIR